jgi:cobalt-zinc-cadmium efflux system protein
MAHQHAHTIQKGLQWAFWLNAFFCIIEFAGGYLTHSSAIVSDAIHDAGDALAIGLSVWLQRIASKGRDEAYTFGYRRYALLSSVILCTLLIAGAVFMSIQGVGKLFHPTMVNSVGMFYLAILGLFINGFAAFMVLRGGKAHPHVHAHGHHPHEHAHEHNSRAVFLHMLEDVLGWAAVLIGAIVIYYTQWYWIDGLLSVAIALYILYNAIPQLIATAKIFLQATPENISLHAIEKDLLDVTGVVAVHDLHAWSMSENYNILTLHVVITTDSIAAEVMQRVNTQLKQHAVQHITLQIEYEGEPCLLQDC